MPAAKKKTTKKKATRKKAAKKAPAKNKAKPFTKGGPKIGGRKKGTPNKVTTDLKNMIHGALMDVGGQEYLAKVAKMDPKSFITLLGKTLPKEQHHSHNIADELVQAMRAADERAARLEKKVGGMKLVSAKEPIEHEE